MHHTSLKLYDNYWRVGYYDGIKFEDWDEYCKNYDASVQVQDLKIWKWIDDSKFKWKVSGIDNLPHPIVLDNILELSKGFVWAVIKATP